MFPLQSFSVFPVLLGAMTQSWYGGWRHLNLFTGKNPKFASFFLQRLLDVGVECTSFPLLGEANCF